MVTMIVVCAVFSGENESSPEFFRPLVFSRLLLIEKYTGASQVIPQANGERRALNI